MNLEVISERLTRVFDRVLPDAAFEATNDADGGVTVKVSAGTHEAEVSRACHGGQWWWEVWQLYPETKIVGHSEHGADDFDGAAAAMVGVLAGAVALERMAVAAA